MNIAYLIPFFPLVGFLVNGLGRHHLSRGATGIIGSGAVLLSFILSIVLFLEVGTGSLAIEPLFTFIQTDSFKIDFAFKIDALSALFLLIITGIGFLIHVYSTAYMHDESAPHFARFFAYLNLFIFSMLLLVLGANFVVMFMGWEGVGLCSYLLIGYWFNNNEYNYAARKAFVMNRIGDLGFLLAVFWILNKTGSVDYDTVFSSLKSFSPEDITIVALLLFVGAMGKSAQIPLYTWLPDAMAGPTPVSALIHAATMVTAGVYMIARSHPLFSLSETAMLVVAITGLATAVLAATIALYQNDIKKVLAYSTVSQLGFMFLALGVGAFTTGVFHVMTHAFFKALLFLGAGSVIHSMSGEQDIIKMGGLRKKIPITYYTFLAGVLAIAGFPFTSGFISKDEILLSVYEYSPLMFWIASATAVLTVIYMFRLLVLVFWGPFRGTEEQAHHVHDSPGSMTIPLIILAVLSIVGGGIQLPHAFGGHDYLNEFLSKAGIPAIAHHDEAAATKEYYLLAGTAIGLALIWFLCVKAFTKGGITGMYTGIRRAMAKKWYVDELYDMVFAKPILALGNFLKNVVEKVCIDGLVNGAGTLVGFSARKLRTIQTGKTGNYILLMVVSLAIIYILFWNQNLIVSFFNNIFK
jgi:NADH-quinone oxidoreductase subunit L